MALEFEVHPLLVLVGAFNPQIMRNAPWIKNYLFPKSSQKEITVNMTVPLMGGELSSSMNIDGIKIVAESGKIQFTPREFNSSGYNALADVVVNLATALPHTPLSAYGINCRLMESPSKARLIKNVTIKRLLGTDFQDNYIKLEYASKYKAGQMTASVIERKVEDSFQIFYDFNFHFKIDESKKMPMMALKNAIIDGAIEEYLSHALKVAEMISFQINPKSRIDNK